MSRRVVVWSVLLVGVYCVTRLLLADEWDLAVVAAIAVATFLLDYHWRHQDDEN